MDDWVRSSSIIADLDIVGIRHMKQWNFLIGITTFLFDDRLAIYCSGSRSSDNFVFWKVNSSFRFLEGHALEKHNEDALSERTCREWFQKFENGDVDVEDKDRSGRPKIYEDAELEKLLKEDSSQTQKELSLTLEVTQQAVSHRLKSLGIIHKQDTAPSDYHLLRSMHVLCPNSDSHHMKIPKIGLIREYPQKMRSSSDLESKCSLKDRKK
ncbi:Mariner Mos1 transposase [Eumeta japonica]|uniref:Mariner Mos1 transposase n=1 Tax=Eumeta variegata TaxID=151549 RepID=A0A4C1UT15_EUMVA|nr:Mariner Mos1 transposase [Eumeta japonica]